ncbi:hypothetical protein MCOR10_011535 [Pyricularia oryzae]|nr:hypothetical protein MCOR10_011535 [Pyricularia oryzae]
MNSGFVNGGFGERGNSAILDKVDKLRELIGSRVSLPQLFVVGDQSSSKSSVLKGITGFACPRDAELCTRRRGPVELNPGNAFSQHLLKVEISSPNQEHLTVINVPGIFRTETLSKSTRRSYPSQKPKPKRNPSDDPAFWAGLTTESDIVLISNIVMTNMKDFRTILKKREMPYPRHSSNQCRPSDPGDLKVNQAG